MTPQPYSCNLKFWLGYENSHLLSHLVFIVTGMPGNSRTIPALIHLLGLTYALFIGSSACSLVLLQGSETWIDTIMTQDLSMVAKFSQEKVHFASDLLKPVHEICIINT